MRIKKKAEGILYVYVNKFFVVILLFLSNICNEYKNRKEDTK